MGLCNSPDIFQEKMSVLMHDLELVCQAYIDDLLVITSDSYSDHLEKLGEVLSRRALECCTEGQCLEILLCKAGTRVFRLLGYPEWYQPPTTTKVNAIADIAVPTNY
jgi:hypothetical protein